ncbi:hypothetical protein [Sphaerotilus microaerophilus]|jgi:hypothetical protein|uniref:Uncharacterized protein n=1 Tax=Sphaerotilus microaerophilus TaxID=2914710 RepID=A0ABM7YQH9_9BURK|nr:hypothetical protein [Sphaerotilus sp. FB-5]BDI06799.1 hypothetical protein CATMQ487_37690 [Sphaerotilus sp. FB-5]
MPRPDSPHSPRRDFPGRRWLIVGLRSLHLVALMPLAVAVLSASTPPGWAAWGLLLTGLGLWGIELWSNPKHRGELAGLFIPLKLAGVAGMIALPTLAPPLFWLLVAASSVVSHAPAGFRHWRPLGPWQDPAMSAQADRESRPSRASKPG